MKLLKLEVVNFGKFSGYTVDLTDGMNRFHHENGFGKTTLAVFIKAMLYGLPASRVQSLDKNERKKFTPWQGGEFGGSLEFESEKGRFRIERFFGAKEANDEFRLFDLSTNKPSKAYSSDVGTELFGIDAEGFEKSIYIAQNGIDVSPDNGSVTAKLTGLLEEVNDMGSFDVANDALEKRRRYYELKGGKGKVAELHARLTAETAERDRCRDLLPIQAEREARLLRKRAEIRNAEEQMKNLREWNRLAEARELHQKECRNAERRLEAWETERKYILNSFRDRLLPTDEELSEARSRLNDYRVMQGRLEALALSPEESARWDSLLASYPNGMPSASTVVSLQAECSQESTLRTRLEAAKDVPESRDALRFRETGIPDAAALDQATERLDRAEQLEARIDALSKEQPAKTSGSSSLLALLLIAIGAVGAVCGLLLPALRLPLLGVGALLILAGAGLLLFGGSAGAKRAAEARKAELRELESKREGALSDVMKFLTAYRSAPTGTQTCRQALIDLSYAAKHAAELNREYADAIAYRENLKKSIADCHARLEKAFSAIGLAAYPADPHQVLTQMYSDTREWTALTEKNTSLSRQRDLLRAEMKELQSDLVHFFDRLEEKDQKKPENCLSRIEELCRKHAILLGNHREKSEELRTRRAQYAETAPAALPDLAEITERISVLEASLEGLRAEESQLHREFKRTVEETQILPEVEDRIASLTAEWKQASENLSLIRRTEEFLQASKEALSTRYLGGMQEHFSKFCRELLAEEQPDARIDTGFDISVRDGGKSRELAFYSRGCRDLLRFCARLSLTESMFEGGELPFLVMDDPFVNLDEKNLAAAKKLLDRLAERFQILYFVCRESES